jgi:hypothetical protein
MAIRNGKTIKEETERELNRIKATIPSDEFEKRESSITHMIVETITSIYDEEKTILDVILAASSKEAKLSDISIILDMANEIKNCEYVWIVDQRDFKYITEGWDKVNKDMKEKWFINAPALLKQLSKPIELIEPSEKAKEAKTDGTTDEKTKALKLLLKENEKELEPAR